MTFVDLTFFVCAAIAIYAGWRVFRTDSMVRASFFLLISFIAVGIIMLLLAAVYLGVALFFMMAVEMMVMALFMMMFMMNPAGLNPMNMVHQEKVAMGIGIAAFVALSGVAVFGDFPSRPVPDGLDPVVSLGKELLGNSMLVFESAGVTLLATMIGVVAMTSHRGRFGEANEGSVPPGLEPGGDPAGKPQENDQKQQGHHHHH
ncbi:MAG: NADH dehydrogenase subunit [Maritimibacter sp.]|nr:NADH dehydrogenase subunit [Maritimibacter sp.]|tara:strand:+ start:783 stop:1391 length:609 start_codon:yes stop_codon:yes gene_type:complete